MSSSETDFFSPEGRDTRSFSNLTDTGYSRESSINPPSRQSSDKFFDDLNEEAPPPLLSTLPERDEAQGFSASAAAGPDIDADVCSIQFDQLGVETIPIFVEEMQKILDIQASENKSKSSSGSIEDTFIDQDKIDKLPEPIKEFADVILLKFLIYNKYKFDIGVQKGDLSPPLMSIYGDTITLKNIILTLIYNCLGDDVVAEMKEIDDSEWYDCIGELGYEPEQGKGGKKGKKGKKRKNTTRKRGGMPPKETKRRVFSALNFLGMVCTSLYDILIIVSIIVSLYYGVQMFIDSYESLKPIRKSLIEPLKASLTNTTYTDLLSESDKELITLDDMSIQYIGENPNEQGLSNKIVDVGTHVVLISLGSLAQIFSSSSEFVHLSTLAALGLNDGSQKMDAIIRDGMDNIFSACFYDLTTTQAISLARTTLRSIHIDQPSRDLIKRIIDGKEAEYERHLSTLPPSPEKLAAEAKEIAEATIPTTEESVGIWSRTVNSVSGFVGTAKDTVVSAAVKGKNVASDLGTALKVATTAIDRGNCMKTEFREIYDDNRRKYEDFMAGIRKQSNKVTTAISYSRTEALTGWAIIGFSLFMLSYLRGRRKERRIEQRLIAVERERRGEDEQLAIGNGDEGNAAGVLAIGNGDEGNVAGVLAIGNAPAPGGQPGGQQGNLLNLGASSLSSNSNVQRIGNYSEDLSEQSFGSFGQDPAFSSLNSSSATSSNASSAAAAAPAAPPAAPPRSTTPGKKRWMAQKQAEENQGNSGGRRTRRRATQTKKRRRPIRRRQTRKLRRNTKRRRM